MVVDGSRRESMGEEIGKPVAREHVGVNCSLERRQGERGEEDPSRGPVAFPGGLGPGLGAWVETGACGG
jgi:hypothetical protein